MLRHIMVPLDGSELAERALPCAEHLATAAGATLHLVRVAEPPAKQSYVPAKIYHERLASETEAATAYLASLGEQRAVASGATIRAAVLIGDASTLLLDYEREPGIDLVVMCSHGRTGPARFAFGSIAERLLRHGTAPLLLVRPFGAPVSLQHVVVPLDGSARAEAALHALTDLLPDVAREVILLRVIDAPDQRPEAEGYLADVVAQVQQAGSPLHGAVCTPQVTQGHPAQAIIDAAGTDKLVVMTTHGRSGVTRWALGSVADRVAHGGAAAVLLMRSLAPRL